MPLTQTTGGVSQNGEKQSSDGRCGPPRPRDAIVAPVAYRNDPDLWFARKLTRVRLAADGIMNPSRFSRWLAGGVALALIAWLAGHGDRETPRKPLIDSRSGTIAASTTSPPHRSSHIAPEPMAAPEPSPSHYRELPLQDVDRLSKLLDRRLNSFGAIRNELLLKFKSPEALRDFLNRTDHSGLRVLGRLDGLMAVRVGFDDLDELRAMIEGDADVCEAIDANFIAKVPDWPNSGNRSPGGQSAAHAK